MNFLITNCWQAGNTGDNAIWKEMLHNLLILFPNSSFTVASQTEEDWDIAQLKELTDIKVVTLHDLEALKKADVVISPGGGYMVNEKMKADLVYFDIAQQMKKITIFGTQTFGGILAEETKKLAKKVFENSELVVAREKESYMYLEDYLKVETENIKVLPDSVFGIGIKKYRKQIPSKSIKICIRGYQMSLEYLTIFAKIADKITENICPVVFVPISHGRFRDDRVQIKKILKLMKNKAISIEDKITAEETKDLLRDGLLITERYHGAIYSLSMNTPVLLLKADILNKMEGLLNTIQYPNKKIFEKERSVEELYQEIEKEWQKQEQRREYLSTVIPAIQKKSKMLYNYIYKCIKE